GYRNEKLPPKNGDLWLPFKEDDIESEELLDFLKKCFQKKEERWNVNELLNHPFMREYTEEVLIPFMKILKYQEYCEWVLKKDVKDSHLVLHKNGLCWYHEGLITEMVYNAPKQ
ncbi:hypothetical protein WA577_006708, partial [Blastocystis sp. JDR]